MIKIEIDNQIINIPDGQTVMQVAASLGITIPAMCYKEGYSNRPSCMVCVVKDLNTGKLFPSCAMPVAEGMKIATQTPDVIEARKEALELLLSDHVGDCEAPCQHTCPAFMDIPLMNRLIASGHLDEALSVVREQIALPLILGYICPAPCEKGCRRKQVDEAVSICLLKRHTARDEARRNSGLFSKAGESGKKVAIIGTGPAGLAAAFYLLRLGHDCTLYDKNEKPGGALRHSITDDKLPKEILDAEIDVIRQMGAQFEMSKSVTKEFLENEILKRFGAVIFTSGVQDKTTLEEFGLETDSHGIKINKDTFETSRIGIFACGNIVRQQQMTVRAVAHGRTTAYSVDSYLRGNKPEGLKHKFNSTFNKLFENEYPEYLKESIDVQQYRPKDGILAGFSDEEAIAEAKRCLHCDCRKPISCKLRNYSTEYHADRKRFLGPVRKEIKKHYQHELIIYEPEKCIKCGLCVEITQKHGESLGLTYVGRGFDVKIDVPFNQTIKEALLKTAKLCVEACPTGALSFRSSEELIYKK